MRVNWTKRYISLGPICTVLGLAFRLSIPTIARRSGGSRHHRGAGAGADPRRRDRTAALSSLQAFPNGPNFGHDVPVPMEWIIGGQEQVGQG
jgi:acyl-CoA dehydrogenase